MIAGACRTAAVVAMVLAMFACSVTAKGQTSARSCPVRLAGAKRLMLVTAKGMNDTVATLRLYQRGSASEPWQARGEAEPAVLGTKGMAWSRFSKGLLRPGEPIKVDGDKRAPAGVFPIGRSFGTLASTRPNYLHVTPDTICVDDSASPAYNTIASRSRLGPLVHAENMSRVSLYRRGLLVDYPTDARSKAGSCIFIHIWRSPTIGTGGCVAVPEPRVEALQDFAADGAVLAILPRTALDRLAGCIPEK
jgi:L,D-peptidoglycan transpeptidase YkuD (ErfK/YbiS/YcfS/YnhG family)